MARLAVVNKETSICESISIAEIADPAPDGMFFVDVGDMACDIGWLYDSAENIFINPNPIPPEESSGE
jgi:hypothetical protein